MTSLCQGHVQTVLAAAASARTRVVKAGVTMSPRLQSDLLTRRKTGFLSVDFGVI